VSICSYFQSLRYRSHAVLCNQVTSFPAWIGAYTTVCRCWLPSGPSTHPSWQVCTLFSA